MSKGKGLERRDWEMKGAERKIRKGMEGTGSGKGRRREEGKGETDGHLFP